MSQDITIELQFFMISIIWGILILLAYDQIRVLRRILPHKIIAYNNQDLLFGLLSVLCICYDGKKQWNHSSFLLWA